LSIIHSSAQVRRRCAPLVESGATTIFPLDFAALTFRRQHFPSGNCLFAQQDIGMVDTRAGLVKGYLCTVRIFNSGFIGNLGGSKGGGGTKHVSQSRKMKCVLSVSEIAMAGGALKFCVVEVQRRFGKSRSWLPSFTHRRARVCNMCRVHTDVGGECVPMLEGVALCLLMLLRFELEK
jgi:hypothetical protein